MEYDAVNKIYSRRETRKPRKKYEYEYAYAYVCLYKCWIYEEDKRVNRRAFFETETDFIMKYVPHSTLNSKWTCIIHIYVLLYAIKPNFDQFVCGREEERKQPKKTRKNEISARIFLCFLVSYFLHIPKNIYKNTLSKNRN